MALAVAPRPDGTPPDSPVESHVGAAQSHYHDPVGEPLPGGLADQARRTDTAASADATPRVSPFGTVHATARRALAGVATVAFVLANR